MPYMTHAETGGSATFPDDSSVIAWYEARGWQVADDPADSPDDQSPAHAAKVDDDAGWVNVVHTESGGTSRIPNDRDVIAEWWDRGWRPANKADQDQTDAPPLAIGYVAGSEPGEPDQASEPAAIPAPADVPDAGAATKPSTKAAAKKATATSDKE